MIRLNVFALGVLFLTSAASADEPRVVVGEGADEFRAQIFDTFQADQNLKAYEGFTTDGFDQKDISVGLNFDTPVVLIEQFQFAPAADIIHERLKFLGDRETPATYLLFIDHVSDFDWTSKIEVPGNVKFTFSSRAAEIGDVAAYYEAVGIDFDPISIRINYSSAVRMAVSQLGKESAFAQSYELKPWTSGKSYYGLLDGGVVVDGWNGNQINKAISPTIRTQWLADHDVVWNSDNAPSAVRQAVMGFVAGNKCTTSWKWKGSEINNVDLQAFGVPKFVGQN
jgi:hypothetical protein